MTSVIEVLLAKILSVVMGGIIIASIHQFSRIGRAISS